MLGIGGRDSGVRASSRLTMLSSNGDGGVCLALFLRLASSRCG